MQAQQLTPKEQGLVLHSMTSALALQSSPHVAHVHRSCCSLNSHGVPCSTPALPNSFNCSAHNTRATPSPLSNFFASFLTQHPHPSLVPLVPFFNSMVILAKSLGLPDVSVYFNSTNPLSPFASVAPSPVPVPSPTNLYDILNLVAAPSQAPSSSFVPVAPSFVPVPPPPSPHGTQNVHQLKQMLDAQQQLQQMQQAHAQNGAFRQPVYQQQPVYQPMQQSDQRQKCIAIASSTKEQCRKDALKGMHYCAQHKDQETPSYGAAYTPHAHSHSPASDEKFLCAGETSRGKPCKNFALDGSDFCRYHG